MIFSGDFFEDEIRRGFLVPSFMKRWWAEELTLLSEINKVCRKHGLKWFAHAGTLLGAVRDAGFIPWDDDIDICMLRPDYEVLKSVFRSEFPPEYKLRSYENDLMEFHICLTNGHLVHEGDELKKHDDYPFVTGIDIFPIDYLPDEESEIKKLSNEIGDIYKAIFYIDDLNKYKKPAIEEKEYLNLLNDIEKRSGEKLDPDKPLLKKLYRLADKRASQNESGKKVANMRDWMVSGCSRVVYPAEWYGDSIVVPFEQDVIPIPFGYAGILSQHFGPSFMVHKKEKAAHDYPAFEQGMSAWKEVMGKPFFRYVFGNRALDDEERQLNATPIQRYRMLLSILPEYHIEISNSIEEKRLNDTMSLLADCQDAATVIGEDLEQWGETYASAVLLLEEYCKTLFMIYEPVSVGDLDVAKDPFSKLNNIYEELVTNLKEEIKGYYKIVFLVRRASEWNTIKKIWEEAKSRKDCVVYVIPVPYSYINTKGDIIEDKWELNNFPKEAQPLDYRVADIASIHPDLIFTQLPYDGYSYSYITSGKYFTDRLYGCCQQLIYVPPFATDDYSMDEDRAIKMMEYCINLSAVDKADNVLVQSENIKNIYMECIGKEDKNFDEQYWDSKIDSTYSGILSKYLPI